MLDYFHVKSSIVSMLRFVWIIAIFPLMAFAFIWQSGESGRVIKIIDGDSFVLETGLIVRLAQIEAPRITIDDSQGLVSKNYLEKLVLNKNVKLQYGGLRRDRMGRALAQVFIDNGLFTDATWINIELLKNGHARVHSYLDNRKNIGEFWLAEREARRNGRGLWSNPKYQARFATNPALIGAEGSFQLVEGIVIDIVQTPKVIKLMFGTNAETDFCAIIPQGSWEIFENGVAGIYRLKGMKIRVRGKVQASTQSRTTKTNKQYSAHGPQIWLDHPEAMEYLLR